jgi:hypothetical protein
MNMEKLHELWPELSDDELRIAEENLARYLEIAWEIYEELDVDTSVP